MRTAAISDVKAHFHAYLKVCEEEPVVVTRNGKWVAVLLPARDEEELERLLVARSSKFQEIVTGARTRIGEGKGISHDAFWEKLMPSEAVEPETTTYM